MRGKQESWGKLFLGCCCYAIGVIERGQQTPGWALPDLYPQPRGEKSHPDVLFIGFLQARISFPRPVISPTNLNFKKEV